MTVPAQAVNPDRISLPALAGRSRPEELLCPDRAAVLEDYLSMQLPESSWPSRPVQSCHWVSPGDEGKLRRRLFEINLFEAVEEVSVPRLHGKPIVAGLFTVPHKETSDRLIIDRRAANQIERRLVWAKLPSGALLARIRLPPGKCLRGSAEDLSSFSICLKTRAMRGTGALSGVRSAVTRNLR